MTILLVAVIAFVATLVVVAFARRTYRVASLLISGGLAIYALFEVSRIHEQQFEKRTQGSIIKPMAYVLEALHSDSQRGDHALLDLKLKRLCERWGQYEKGETVPECFMNEVANLERDGSFPKQTPSMAVAQEASDYLSALLERGFLSDIRPEKRFSVRTEDVAMSPFKAFPFQITMVMTFDCQRNISYRFVVAKDSGDAPWVLKEAWQAGATGVPIGDPVPLPSEDLQTRANDAIAKEK